MPRPESPYRRPARPRAASDLLGALAALACIALVVVGAAVALGGCYDLAHGGGDPARAVLLAGLALLMGCARVPLSSTGAGGA
jgi:hypothetical protein